MIFDGPNKRIVLTSTSTSASEIWSEWVKWLDSDFANTKWPVAMKQVGGDDLGSGLLIPPYIFLLNGWRIRPMESNHLLVITGNIFVDGGGQPVVNTLGAFNVSIQYTVPMQAQGYSTTSSGGSTLTAEQVWSHPQRELTSASTSSLTLEEHNKLMSLDTSLVDANIVSVQDMTVTSVDDFKADVSGISVNVDPEDIWLYPSRTLTESAGLTTEEHNKLMSLDTSNANVDLTAIANAVWTSVTRTLTSASGPTKEEIAQSVWWFGGRTLSSPTGLTDSEKIILASIADNSTAIKSKTDKMTFDVNSRIIAFLNDRSEFSLTNDERVALANEIERQIIDDSDSEKVLQAIVDKIAQANPSLDDLTLGAISSAVWSSGSRTLTTQAITLTQEEHDKLMGLDTTNLDTPVSTRARPQDVIVNPTLQIDERLKLMSLDTSKLDVNVSTRATASDLVVNPTLTTQQNNKLMSLDTSNLDVPVSSRARPDDLVVYPTLTTQEHDKLMSLNTDLDLNAIAQSVWWFDTRSLTVNQGLSSTQQAQIQEIIDNLSQVKAKTDKLNFDVTNRVIAFLNDRSGFGLSVDERIAIANEVEKQIIDETDSEKVLTAITNKIAEVNPSLDELTVGAIANAVWTVPSRTLSDPLLTLSPEEHTKLMSLDTSKLDVEVSSRARPSDVVISPSLQPDERMKLMSLDTSKLDATVSSRATKDDVVVHPSLQSDERLKLMGLENVNLDIVAIARAVWDFSGRTLTDDLGLTSTQIQQLNEIQGNVNNIVQTTSRFVFDVTDRVLSYVDDKTGYQLSTTERTAIANEVERQIIDDNDSEKVLQAIVNKISQLNPSFDGLTVNAIATAVWGNATRSLTTQVGLTTQEHDKLMSLPTVNDIWSYTI